MKTILSLALPAWVGASIGAAIDDYAPDFWLVWMMIGIVLAVITTNYVRDRRTA